MATARRRLARTASTLIGTALVSSIALTGAVPAGAAPAITTDRAKAAASWLATRLVDASHAPSAAGDHLEDKFGSSFFFSGTTLDVVFALAAAGVGRDKTTAIMSSVASHLAEYTQISDITGKPGPSDGQVAKVALAALVAGVDPRRFAGHDLLNTLQVDQCTTVSEQTTDFTVPNCPAIGAGRNIFASVSQSLVLLAQARAGITASAASIRYLKSLQCSNGGFTIAVSVTAGCTPDIDATAYAAFALGALGGQDAELTAATNWLAGQRNPAGYWVAQGIPNPNSTGLATAALGMVGADVQASRQWLLSQQVLDGPTLGASATRGALKYNGTVNASSTKATADGLLGLVDGASFAKLTSAASVAGLPVLPLTASITLNRVRGGGSLTAVVGGFIAGEPVRATLRSSPVTLATVLASASGTATLTFTVPRDIAAGVHTVTLTGTSSQLSASLPFTVVGAAPTTTMSSTSGHSTVHPAAAQTLPATGRDDGRLFRLLVSGLVLLLAGTALTVLARRQPA